MVELGLDPWYFQLAARLHDPWEPFYVTNLVTDLGQMIWYQPPTSSGDNMGTTHVTFGTFGRPFPYGYAVDPD